MKKTLIYSVFALALLTTANAQIITTIAGTGTAGFSGDGGPGTAAQLNNPRGVAVDATDNVYIADYSNNRVRRVTPTRTISTIAGTSAYGFGGDGGPATAALLDSPSAVVIDNSGNLFISDTKNGKIRKVSSTGVITSFATAIGGPVGITIASSGDICVIIGYVGVYNVNSSGILTGYSFRDAGFTGDGGPVSNAKSWWLDGIAVDAAGNKYITDRLNNVIRKVTPSWIVSTVFGTTMGIDTAHWYYSTNGGYSGDGGSATSAKMNTPSGIAIDRSGNTYIADTKNHCIRKVSTSGIISTIAGNGSSGFSGDGGAATAAQLSYPTSVAVDIHGNIYVADSGNQRIRRIGNAGLATPALTSAVRKLFVYPNPSAGSVTIELPEFTGSGSITIIDMIGRIVETRNVAPNHELKESFKLKNAAGTYIVKVDAGGETYKETVEIR